LIFGKNGLVDVGGRGLAADLAVHARYPTDRCVIGAIARTEATTINVSATGKAFNLSLARMRIEPTSLSHFAFS